MIIPEKYLLPSYKDKEGKEFLYRQHVLEWNDYLIFSPIKQKQRGTIIRSIGMEISQEKNGIIEDTYVSCGGALSKEKWIRFTVSLQSGFRLPYKITFRVENHGQEANDDLTHSQSYTIEKVNHNTSVYHWEHTRYRGLHYMIITVQSNSHKDIAKIGVYIK